MNKAQQIAALINKTIPGNDNRTASEPLSITVNVNVSFKKTL